MSGGKAPLGYERQEESRLDVNPDSKFLIVPFSQVI